jgi:hypothetical protein
MKCKHVDKCIILQQGVFSVMNAIVQDCTDTWSIYRYMWLHNKHEHRNGPKIFFPMSWTFQLWTVLSPPLVVKNYLTFQTCIGQGPNMRVGRVPQPQRENKPLPLATCMTWHMAQQTSALGGRQNRCPMRSARNKEMRTTCRCPRCNVGLCASPFHCPPYQIAFLKTDIMLE